MGRTIHTGRPHIDNSPPGGWTRYGAEKFQQERMDGIYDRANKRPGKYRIILTKPSGSKLIDKREFKYGDAMREVATEEKKKLNWGLMLEYIVLKKSNQDREEDKWIPLAKFLVCQ